MKHNDNSDTRLVSGVLDVVDRRAVLRADGYLPGPHDIAVAPRLVA